MKTENTRMLLCCIWYFSLCGSMGSMYIVLICKLPAAIYIIVWCPLHTYTKSLRNLKNQWWKQNWYFSLFWLVFECVSSVSFLFLFKRMLPFILFKIDKVKNWSLYFFTHLWKKSNKTSFPFLQSISTYCTPLILVKMHHIGIISWRLLMSFWL